MVLSLSNMTNYLGSNFSSIATVKTGGRGIIALLNLWVALSPE